MLVLSCILPLFIWELRHETSDRVAATLDNVSEPASKANGRGDHRTEVSNANLSIILSSLQTMRDGDFSVRLPGNWTNLEGKNRGHIQRDCHGQPKNGQGAEAGWKKSCR